MSVITIPKPLRLILGEEATDALVTVINNVDLESKKELATKGDIQTLKTDVVRLEGKITLLQWMLGILIASNISLVLKAFFIP